jgi:hypothetical protein
MSKNETPTKIVRTSSGLREALFSEWDALNDGRSNPKMAMAKAHIAKQVINSVKIEIEFASHVRSAKEGEMSALTAPIALGGE